MTGALLLLVAGNSAMAQPYPMQPAFMSPGISTTRVGMFYFNAGVRYRSIQTARLSREEGYISLGTIGTPPFGPDDGRFPSDPAFGTPIPFGTATGITGLQAFPLAPTYLPAGDPRTSGIWIYQDGQVDASITVNCVSPTCTNTTPPPPTIVCPCFVTAWPNGADMLGRHRVGQPAPLGTCCDDNPTTLNVGSFIFFDRITQTDNPNSVSDTKIITWHRAIDGTYNASTGAASTEVASLIAGVARFPYGPVEFYDKLWCPSFEAGMQFGSYFDVFSGFSFYNTSHAISKTFTSTGIMSRRAFADAFPFFSDQFDTTWPAGHFTSENTIIGTTPAEGIFNYQISVDGILEGRYPTRTFYLVGDPSIPGETLQEAISHRSDVNVYEFRFGGRSWIPLYGMGRFGVFAGTLANYVTYNISGSELITGLGPNFPGQQLYALIQNQSDNTWSFGGFAGTDVEIGFGRWFAKWSAEYSVAQEISYRVLSSDFSFRPSGFQMAISGGIGF